MRGDPLAAVEQLDGARGDASPDLLAQQAMGRGVVVLVDLDVIVEPDRAFLPDGEGVGLGGQRLERRTASSSKSARRLAPRCRDTRSLSCATSSATAAFSAVSEKKRRLRSLATMKRVATWTAASTFALSRGLCGRAGTMAVS